MFTSLEKIQDAVRKVLTEFFPDRTEEKEGQIRKLKEEIAELQFKKGLEEKEIKHLVRMKEDKQFVEAEKQTLKLAREFQEKEMALQTNYHEKVMKTLEESRKEIRDIYGEIMKRLPNVNMSIKQGS